jgi:hypothetical protein
MEVIMHLHEQGGDEFPRTPLPNGLYYCRFCGEVAGHLGEIKSTCLCEGIPCRSCGIGRVRRPISDTYDPATGSFWHVPYFMGMGACRGCKITVFGGVPQEWHSWPGPLGKDPLLRELLDTIKEAGLALSSERARPLAQDLRHLPLKPGLYAVHGGAKAWDDLGLEKPPDERPLCVGRAGALLPAELCGRGDLGLAAWDVGDCDPERLEQELCNRWQAPLRTHD